MLNTAPKIQAREDSEILIHLTESILPSDLLIALKSLIMQHMVKPQGINRNILAAVYQTSIPTRPGQWTRRVR